MFKKIFKSKTVITSASTFLMAVIGILSNLSHGIFGLILPKEVILVLTLAGVVLSEILNKFFPSGQLIGHGQNWSMQKYIAGFALAAIAFLQSEEVIKVFPDGWGVVITASVIPALQLVVRIFGGATRTQVAASR